ncbi:transposase-like protein [Salinibacter ruber]|nr:transposase-like protein [Salinibacter ruber]
MKTAFERSTSVQPEGIWTSLRNRLRRFRGVHKDHLSGYVAMFELAFNHDQITPALLQRMCGA